MIVVADTTPLRYLVVIERDHLLPALYGRVLIPPAVAEELNQGSTHDVVRAWLASRPTGSKLGGRHIPFHLKWTWTKASKKQLPWPRNFQPTCFW